MIRIPILPDGFICIRPEDILVFGKGVSLAYAGISPEPHYFVALKHNTVTEYPITEGTMQYLQIKFGVKE